MNLDDGVEVFSILGNEYSVKAPPGEQQALRRAFDMLERTLAQTKRSHPTLVGDRLLVLAALNLCQRQVELSQGHAQAMDQCKSRIDALVSRCSDTGN
ncbi:ZapA [Pseudomonas sp. Leaf129]|uniref:cell division protein ZapA n=1 Tax=Pseudomonas sp. Leaf129 TaxID=1736268 RepID=UPI0007035025|nr:cell division protein ZapA [Pseudomonas sp. Leaf129]KQQ57727.1 ZapA [Pseudomonas sp. Leaf129]